MTKVECICIDDTARPKVVHVSKWPIKDNVYHITHVFFHPEQDGGVQGVSLAEIELDEYCSPYESYRLSRFAFRPEDLAKLIELMSECAKLNGVDVDIHKLVKDIELIPELCD